MHEQKLALLRDIVVLFPLLCAITTFSVLNVSNVVTESSVLSMLPAQDLSVMKSRSLWYCHASIRQPKEGSVFRSPHKLQCSKQAIICFEKGRSPTF